MIRLFNVYYPVRTLVLLIGEALIVWTSFLLGAFCMLGQDTYLALNYEGGYFKIFGVTALVLLCSHWLDLYDTARLNTKGELYFRLLMVPGVLAFILAAIAYVRPNYLLGSGSSEVGLVILTVALLVGALVLAGWCSCPFWWSASMCSALEIGRNASFSGCVRTLKSASRSRAGRERWKAR